MRQVSAFLGVNRNEDAGTEIDTRSHKARGAAPKVSASVRVPRAETRLTVYRSPLVDFARFERADIKVDVFSLDLKSQFFVYCGFDLRGWMIKIIEQQQSSIRDTVFQSALF